MTQYCPVTVVRAPSGFEVLDVFHRLARELVR